MELLVREVFREYGISYREEVPIGRYSVDFVLPAFALAVEADGPYWHGKKNETEARAEGREQKEQLIAEAGYSLIRLASDDLKKDPEREVLKSIFAALQARTQ